jgi:hypothetical protein
MTWLFVGTAKYAKYPRTTLPSHRPCSGTGPCRRRFKATLMALSVARILFGSVWRVSRNCPRCDFPQMWTNPRKLNVSAAPRSPRPRRFAFAYRPNSMSRVLPSCSSSANSRSRPRRSSKNRRPSSSCWHPTASVPLILRTLVADGRLAAGVVSDTKVARLYRDAGLERGVVVDGHTRLRWQADHAGVLWHGDVCHGPTLRIGKTTRPLRIHAMLDDASRFVVALEALHAEREADMLDVLLAALRRHGAPDAIYLDYVPRNIIRVLCPTALCGGQRLFRSKVCNPFGVRGHIRQRAESGLLGSGCSDVRIRDDEGFNDRALFHDAQDYRPGSPFLAC